MLSQLIAFLAAGALLAFAIATLLAGRSLWIVTRAVIGWSFAVLAAVLAFAALIIVAARSYMSDHAPTAPLSARALSRSEERLLCVGLAAKGTTSRRRAVRPAARVRRSQPAGAAHKGSIAARTAGVAPPTAARPAGGAPNGSSAPRLAATLAPAAGDAILALISLGYSKAEAASAIADAVASLGVNTEAPLLIKAILRARIR